MLGKLVVCHGRAGVVVAHDHDGDKVNVLTWTRDGESELCCDELVTDVVLVENAAQQIVDKFAPAAPTEPQG